MEKFDFIDSKFRYAIIAAKRAKQIVKGSKKRIDTDYQNPLNIAIDEIAHGKVNFEVINREELNFGDSFEEEFTTRSKEELLLDESDNRKVSGMKDILMSDSGKAKIDTDDDYDDDDDDSYDDDDDDNDDDNYDDDSDDDNYDDDDDDDDSRNRYDDDFD